MDSHNGGNLPPPPPIPKNFVPMKVTEQQSKRVPLARPGFARRGQPIPLLTNHFKVSVRNVDDYFYHYSVVLKYEDDRPVDGKGIGRKVIDKLKETYDTELGGKNFAYDGEKTLFTLGPLPQVNNEFTVVLEDLKSNRKSSNGSPDGDSPGTNDRKRAKRPYQTKTFKVELSFATKVPMQAIAMALKGQENENYHEALRVLDIILRQHAAKKGCLLVRQSFFQNNPANFTDLGGGVVGCRGFHSSFRPTQSGLSLNIDVSTTMIVKPGPVIDFLIENQNVRDPYHIDWTKAKRVLKNLRIVTTHTKSEFKIIGLSELPCNEERFQLKESSNNESPVEVTVYEYFCGHYKHLQIKFPELPCINVGKPKRPTFIPIELCELVSLQRYTKALSTFQRAQLVEKSRQKPQERMRVLTDALRYNDYDAEPMLRACGISISTNFTRVDGRVLQAPKLKVGNGEDFSPRFGRWNFSNKKLIEPTKIEKWAVVNFSCRCDTKKLVRDLLRCAEEKGITIEAPFDVIEEEPSRRRAPATARVEDMIEKMKTTLPGVPKFLLCLLPEKRNSNDIYGPWKRKCLSDIGIVTQCMAPPPNRLNDQYLHNLLLKINAKLGGLNSLLAVEHSPAIPFVSKTPTIILGMDVSHGSPGRSDVPSIAAVVSSRQWPLISKYRATVRTQSPKVEMVDSLFKPVSDKEDEGIIRELLLDFYTSSQRRKPDHIIVFRDGVSESQFSQVLNIELDQIIEACKFLDNQWSPKFTLIIAQKNHHTKFFQPNSPDNVPPGTVVDNQICHPRNYDFYMCAHNGPIGTSRPTHYHVLYDEIGFSQDDLQELVHSLSYVYQRSTCAISVVAPICYAHLAATQMGQFIKFDEMSETSSGRGSGASVPEMPRLDEKVSSTMFFC